MAAIDIPRFISVRWRIFALTSVVAVLSACGDDAQQQVAKPASSSKAAPAAASDPVSASAAVAPHSSHGDDVMKWLQMSPDKAKVDPAKQEPPSAAAKPTATTVASTQPSAPAPALNTVRSEPAPAPANVPPIASTAATSGGGSSGNNPPLLVASANPTSAPAPTSSANTIKLLAREQPAFPREALRAGVSTGRVTAKLYIGVDGSVTKVDIVESEPHKVFDKAVMAAAMHWKYGPLSQPQTVVAEFNFKNEE